MAITIDYSTSPITINVPQSDLTLISGTLYELNTETLRQAIIALQDDEVGIAFEDAIRHNTEITVAGTIFARTIEVLNNTNSDNIDEYQIKFTPDSQWSVRFTGSNNNIFDVQNGILVQNQVQVIPGNSAGLQSFPQQELDNVKFLIATLKKHHTGQGNIWYWDPISGDDNLAGTSHTSAFKTFAAAHAAAGDGTHDIIIALAISSQAQTIVTETITITKDYLFLRGPGRDFKFKPTATDVPTISINAVGVEVSSMIVETADTGGQNAIEIQDGSDFFWLDYVWSHDVDGDGIEILGTVDHGHIDHCFFHHIKGNGIHINGNVGHCRIESVELVECEANGILIEGTTAKDIILGGHSEIYGSTEYGIRINAPSLRVFIGKDLQLHDNTLGNILDNGQGTMNGLETGDTGYTPSQLMQIIASSLAGKLSGAEGTTVTIRNVEDSADTIVATVDADGNRLTVTITPPTE